MDRSSRGLPCLPQPEGARGRALTHDVGSVAAHVPPGVEGQYCPPDGELCAEAFGRPLLIVGMSLEDDYLKKQLKEFRRFIQRVAWLCTSPPSPRHLEWAHYSSVEILVVDSWNLFWEGVGRLMPKEDDSSVGRAWLNAVGEVSWEVKGPKCMRCSGRRNGMFASKNSYQVEGRTFREERQHAPRLTLHRIRELPMSLTTTGGVQQRCHLRPGVEHGEAWTTTAADRLPEMEHRQAGLGGAHPHAERRAPTRPDARHRRARDGARGREGEGRRRGSDRRGLRSCRGARDGQRLVQALLRVRRERRRRAQEPRSSPGDREGPRRPLLEMDLPRHRDATDGTRQRERPPRRRPEARRADPDPGLVLRARADERKRKGRKPGLAAKAARNIWGEVTSGVREASTSKIETLRVRTDDPTRAAQAPATTDDRDMAALYPSELLALLAAPAGKVPTYRRVLYAMAAYSGLRIGELRGLTKESIDVEHAFHQRPAPAQGREGQREARAHQDERRAPAGAHRARPRAPAEDPGRGDRGRGAVASHPPRRGLR